MSKKKNKIRKIFSQNWRRFSWWLYRKNRILRKQYTDFVKDIKGDIKIHLGCGGKRFEGYINIDAVPTEGSDMVMDVVDLSVIPSNSISEIFMKSVFEHFYRHQQDQILREYHRVLKKGGKLVISVPDFDVAIDAYVRKEKGIVGEIFDLNHVRQYIFGELVPENPFYQLHKDIFNKESIKLLLEKNGFIIERLENIFFENQHLPLTISVTGIK